MANDPDLTFVPNTLAWVHWPEVSFNMRHVQTITKSDKPGHVMLYFVGGLKMEIGGDKASRLLRAVGRTLEWGIRP